MNANAKVKTDKQLAAELGTNKLQRAKALNAKRDDRDRERAKSKAMLSLVSDTAGKGKSLIEVDMAIELAMPFNKDTTANKSHERLFAPGEANIQEVMRLVNSGNLSIEIEGIGRDVMTLQWKLAHMAVAIAYLLQQNGHDALPIALDFLAKLEPLSKDYSILRSVSMRDWLLKYAPVDWKEPNNTDKRKTLVYSSKKRSAMAPSFGRNKQKFVAERLEKPFFLFKKQPDPADFDLKKQVQALMKKVEGIKELTPAEREEKYRTLDLDGQQAFLKFCHSFLKVQSSKDNAANDDEEQKEEADKERVM